MKVLNVHMTVDPIMGGGGAERTFQMSRFLAKNGIECTLMTIDIGLTPQRIKDLEGVNVIILPSLLKRFYIPKFSYRKVRDVIKDVDIIHLMNQWTFLNALVYFIARRLKKPYVVCPAGTLPIYHRSKFIKKLYNWVVGKKIIRDASGYIAISPNEIPQFEAYGVAADKISVIPNGINQEDFKESDNTGFRRKYGLADFPLILFMGRLNYIKGPDILLRAFCNIKDRFKHYHLVFAGPDQGMLPELKNIVTEFGAEERVHFLGYLGGIDKTMAYYASDLLAIPSRQEAMSIVILEAGITGTPGLITEKCGFNEIADFDGGIVVPASVDGLEKGLSDILDNPIKLKSMGQNLKKYIHNHFTWDVIIDKYIPLYDGILGKTQKLKIAISMLSGISYGGLTYFRHLLPALAKADKINEYHIFVQKGNPSSEAIKQDNFFFHECIQDAHSASIRFLWEQLIFPKELSKRKIDIVFTAKNVNVLFAPCKKIISIRNVEPLCYRNYKNHWKLNVFSWLREKFTKISIKKADRVIAVSKSTKNYLKDWFPGISHELDIIYHGNSISTNGLSTNFHSEKSQFLLSSSKFISYANQFNLIEGYSLLYEEKRDLPPLWLAGGVHDPMYFKKIKKLIRKRNLQEKVKILGLVSHERLVELYSSALAFIFPSTLEACPQTLIEAMACGVPVVTSNINPMPEICDDAAIYFNPFDKEDIANKIDMLLTDFDLRESLRKKSLERCQFFDWDKTATEIVKVFKKV